MKIRINLIERYEEIAKYVVNLSSKSYDCLVNFAWIVSEFRIAFQYI